MRSLSRPVRKKLILIYFTAWNVSKQRINKKQHHPIHLQMPFPPPVSKTMGRWSLPVLVDLLKTRATAALVTDLCALRWRVICLRRAECFTKLMNSWTLTQHLLQLRETTQQNESHSYWYGVLRAQSERLLNLLSSLFRWSWSTSWGGAIPRRVFRKDYPLYGMYGNPAMLWNPEYRKILLLQESRIPLTITIQIHVPQWSWLESGIYGVESRIQDCVKFPRRWGKISRQETYYVNTRSEKTGGSQKRFLWPFRPQFGQKMRGGGPPGPLPWIRPLSDTDAACARTVLL